MSGLLPATCALQTAFYIPHTYCYQSFPPPKLERNKSKAPWTFQVLYFYSFWQHANLIGPSLKKNETMETPQNKRVYFDVYSSSPLAHLYRWKENTIFQCIWDQREVVWRTRWEKHCKIEEHIGNLKGT